MPETRTLASYPSLQNRSVFITGGGSGIGESLVRRFCRQGARVAFVDLAEAPSRALFASLAAEGLAAPLYIPCDLRDIEALRAAIAEAARICGPIEVLCNNAGNDDRHQTEEVSVAY
jgi:NAD(P)-dependent dehydrogenase (short-subunit alcohol dehydrogenase family)